MGYNRLSGLEQGYWNRDSLNAFAARARAMPNIDNSTPTGRGQIWDAFRTQERVDDMSGQIANFVGGHGPITAEELRTSEALLRRALRGPI
jgi:hypothetical protein